MNQQKKNYMAKKVQSNQDYIKHIKSSGYKQKEGEYDFMEKATDHDYQEHRPKAKDHDYQEHWQKAKYHDFQKHRPQDHYVANEYFMKKVNIDKKEAKRVKKEKQANQDDDKKKKDYKQERKEDKEK